MAFKISKKDDTRLNDLRDKLAEARATLDDNVEAESKIIEDAIAAINEHVGKYNEVLGEARGVIEDIAAEMEDEFEERSENWKDGDRGQTTREWLDAISDIHTSSLDEVEELPFEAPALEIEDHAEIIDNMDREPNY